MATNCTPRWRVETTMASEVQGLGRSLDAAPDGALFLQELLAKWQQHIKAVSVTRDILMYMDRTFVPTTHKTPVRELGRQPVARDDVVRSGKVRPRLIEAVRRVKAGEGSAAVPGDLMAGVTKMLTELGDEVYHEVMDAPPSLDE